MNGKFKIFSKANMLDQYVKMALVLTLSVILSIVLNNTFILGELILSKLNLDFLSVKAVKIAVFSVLGIVSYVALQPFNFAKEIWFYENARKNRLPVKNLFFFYKIKKSPGAVRVMFTLQAIKIITVVLFLLPAIAVGGYILFSFRDGIGQNMLIALVISFVLLTVTGAFFSFVYLQKYFLVPFLFYENEPCRVRDVIKLSSSVMEKKCFETAFLKISFFPWMLLYVLIFPAVYVYPYYKLTISLKAISILNNT